jgi:hypothetical protein
MTIKEGLVGVPPQLPPDLGPKEYGVALHRVDDDHPVISGKEIMLETRDPKTQPTHICHVVAQEDRQVGKTIPYYLGVEMIVTDCRHRELGLIDFPINSLLKFPPDTRLLEMQDLVPLLGYPATGPRCPAIKAWVPQVRKS